MTGVGEEFDWLVFDLGGVLIELDGPPISPRSSQLSESEIWDTWLRSDAVRLYESGMCDRFEFAARLVNEFKLTCNQDQLLDMFTAWPVGFYAEVEEMMERLNGQVKLACLSNTNELHWQRFSAESDVFSHFDQVFLSFEMGLTKPDQAMFTAAEAAMETRPERILYLDDNKTIIQAANEFGWQAHHSQGISEVVAALKKHRLL